MDYLYLEKYFTVFFYPLVTELHHEVGHYLSYIIQYIRKLRQGEKRYSLRGGFGQLIEIRF